MRVTLKYVYRPFNTGRKECYLTIVPKIALYYKVYSNTNLVRNVEPRHEVKVHEHPDNYLDSQGVAVLDINKLVAVQQKIIRLMSR